MAPRTRRSQTIETVDNTHENQVPLKSSMNRNNTPTRGGVKRQTINTRANNRGRKRTTSSSNLNATSNLEVQTTSEIPPNGPNKRARNAGPPRSRPLPLKLVSGGIGDVASQPLQAGVSAAATTLGVSMEKEKIDNNRELRRTFAFYGDLPQDSPCEQNVPSAFAPSDSGSEVQNDSHAETEPDSGNDQEMIELAQRQPSKFQEALTLERPSWNKPASTSGPSPMGTHTGGTVGNNTSHLHSTVPASASAAGISKTWPPETELVISKKMKLCLQQPVIRVLLQDANERVWVSLLFDNAFPDTDAALKMIRESILAAAERFEPGTSVIHERLKCDDEYLSKMIPLPRARIPLIRHEIKQYCNALVLPFFTAIKKDPEKVTAVVAKELKDYSYIYPTAPNTSNLVMHMRPYRNHRIITILRYMYFIGGPKSFAARFDCHFPRFEERDGTISREVPVPMLALVATALYTAIYEWRSGSYVSTNFSTAAYLDIYRCNINTINGIEKGRRGAFHRMMSDIYSLASSAPSATTSIVTIDLDALEE